MEGPEFLRQPEKAWPTSSADMSVTADDPEVKRSVTVNATVLDTNPTSQLMNHFSDWQRLKTAVAWIIKLKKTLLKLSKKKKELLIANTSAKRAPSVDVHQKMQGFATSLGNQKVSLEDLREAEMAIITFCQREKFPTEFAALTAGKPEVPKSSSIYKLDPVLAEGVLRVGGRLNKAAIPEEIKHPLILSKDQHISKLLLRHIHLQLGHGGRNHVLSTASRKFWITSGPSAVRNIISRCTEERLPSKKWPTYQWKESYLIYPHSPTLG